VKRLALLPLLLLATCTSATPAAPSRPNLVLILADDMGFSDLGSFGSEIRTPHLDALAAGGMTFRQFYNGARCCPTRASLLTGLYAHQAGIGHMVEDRGRPSYIGRLNDRCVTLAEALRPAGYRTLMSGKWHVGAARPHWPVDRGFDRSYSLIRGDSNYFHLLKGGMLAKDGELITPPADPSFYFTDAFSDQAVKFLEDSRREPFFLYLAYTAPHWPLQARPEDIARYRETYKVGWDVIRERRFRRMVELGIADPSWTISPREVPWASAKDAEREADKMAVYAAMIHRMDEGIGRVLKKLREIGAWENTLVLFLSDNGASPEEYDKVTPTIAPGPAESFHTTGPSWARVSNTPFRGDKRSTHEGGISTPLLASWPAIVRPGTVSREPAHLIDIMATFVDVAGAVYPTTIPPPEGRSLRPAFEGRAQAERSLFWEHEGNRAVRRGKWKLVSRFQEPWELYDIDADRTETTNLAARHPEVARDLAAQWDAWSARCGVVPWKDLIKK
jgi:arylsulfatase A-like enzyme